MEPNLYDDIRPPDEIQSDQLLSDDRDDYEKEIDEVIKVSLQEMKICEIRNDDFEKQVIKDYEKELLERRNMFSQLLKVLIKLSKYDDEIKNIYEIIDPIIESYCGQFIEKCDLDVETYNKIFKILGSIRLEKNIIEKLKTIIVVNK